MKLYAKENRTIKTATLLQVMRESGYTTRHIGEWDRWKDMRDGGRLQVKIDVYEVKNEIMTAYLVSDSLGRVAAPLTEDKKEVMEWLEEKGYKTDKEWYMQDCGMNEETWEEWNK